MGIDLGIDATSSLDVFATPIPIRAAIRAHASASLADDDLIFSALTIDELHLNAPGTPLGAVAAATLETTFRALLAQMAERSLNDALPRLPVPAFTVPEALGVYGLPAGAKLGIVGSTLATNGQHAVLRGGFGVR